ncbi:MAG: hypothetical protein Q7T55_21435, partial [Solirubrobacteraceae bacterium]|nr:hypothetical protein [Solirubrobacteraceae bacterium]
MSVLDDLERSLSRAVDRGAAAAEAPSPSAARARGLRRLRPRRGWHVFLTILAAGGLTTGALAATGQLKVVSSNDRGSNPNYMVMTFPGWDSEATEQPTLLPMRVK